MLSLEFTVVRHRTSVTQGEAEVFCNGKSIVRFGDNIELGGRIETVKGWGSTKENIVFIKAAIRDYNKKIIDLIQEDKEMDTFLDLLRSGKELDCELIIGNVDMPASFVWDETSKITDYGVEKFKPIMEAKYEILENGNIEIFCDDYELGEIFCMASAGYIGSAEFVELFGPPIYSA